MISKVSCADVHEADVLHGDVNTQLWLSRSFRAMSTILACHISITVYYVHLVFFSPEYIINQRISACDSL